MTRLRHRWYGGWLALALIVSALLSAAAEPARVAVATDTLRLAALGLTPDALCRDVDGGGHSQHAACLACCLGLDRNVPGALPPDASIAGPACAPRAWAVAGMPVALGWRGVGAMPRGPPLGRLI